MSKIGFTFGGSGAGGSWEMPPYNPNASGVKINDNNTGIQYGQTTLDKLLSTLLSGIALTKGAGYIPTTQQPQTQQYQLTPYDLQMMQQQQLSNSTAGKAAEGLEKFISENTGLLLVAGVGVVLFMSGRK